MEDQENLIELIDDNGNTVQFEHLATLEYEGEYYIALTETDDDENSEEAEVVIMKIDDSGAEECYIPVEDESLQAAIFDKFLELISDSTANEN